jgi:hypothetical protein
MMLIAIRCDAGRDVQGTERKVTILIDHMGKRHETWMEWPDLKAEGIHWGPILSITPEEYLRQSQIACGEA